MTLQDLSPRTCGFLLMMVVSGCDHGPTEAKPESPPAPITFASIDAGGFFTCGVAVEGTAYCWGWSEDGQVGNGWAIGSVKVPVAVPDLQFRQISTSTEKHSCGVTISNAVYCWGSNLKGQLGTASTMESCFQGACSTTPNHLEGLALTSVSAGMDHTCGVDPDGQAYCWGDNESGQLGTGSSGEPSLPVRVGGGFTFQSVVAGGVYSCGLSRTGAAYCWGMDTYGGRGTGSTGELCNGAACATTPRPVLGGFTFIVIAGGNSHVCALTEDNKAYCWGEGNFGQLGTGQAGLDVRSTAPVPVAGGLTFSSITVGFSHTCGLTGEGKAYCWGSNFHGQLGDGSSIDSAVPVLVSGGLSFESISAGGGHTCGIASDGAYCWGGNDSGALGTGTIRNSTTPVKVVGQS